MLLYGVFMIVYVTIQYAVNWKILTLKKKYGRG